MKVHVKLEISVSNENSTVNNFKKCFHCFFDYSNLHFFRGANFDPLVSIRNGENIFLKSAATVILISKAHLQEKLLKKIEDISAMY